MEKNDIVRLTITDIGTDGEGVGKLDTFTIFVNNAVPGDEADIRITKVKKNYAYGRIEKIITPSADRVEPQCHVAIRCGGCSIQQVSYKTQLKYKEKKVFDCLTRIGGVDPEYLKGIMEPAVGMDEPWHFRNKAQYPVGTDKDGNVRIGFYAKHSHSIIENDECQIENPVAPFILLHLRKIISKFNITPYNEETGRGTLRHCMIRVGVSTGEVMICLVINAHGKEAENWKAGSEMSEAMTTGFMKAVADFNASPSHHPDMPEYKLASFCVNINTENTNVIMGKKVFTVYGAPCITDKIGDVLFRISPLAFYQVNPIQTKKLYDKALSYALSGFEDGRLGVVWDLYCGIGTISLFLARHAKKVYGVEIVPEAIQNAKENAKINNISNAEFFVGAAEDVVEKLNDELTNCKHMENSGFDKNHNCDVVVVDPPRKGCDEVLLKTVISMSPKSVVYVSCDPATLARDVKFLLANGYSLKKVCPVDQFCHSGHVETVVQLVNIRAKPDYTVRLEVDVDEFYKTVGEDKRNYLDSEEYKKIKAKNKDK